MENTTHKIEREDGKYRATCLVCGYSLVRSKREQAVWGISNHVAYSHEDIIYLHDGKGAPA